MHRTAAALLLLLLFGACRAAPATTAEAPAGAEIPATSLPSPDPAPSTTTTTVMPTTTTTSLPYVEVVERWMPFANPPRSVFVQEWLPFATVGPLTLLHPSSRVERVGFHESGHDGARQMVPAATAIEQFTMETRDRDTGSRTAADIAVDPFTEIRSPVTGTVLRSGTYILYCRYRDDFAVIEPDDRPGWEVKVLHISFVAVEPGDRVVAGETVIASGPTPLEFRSQIDDATADPSWPHVHIEVVDPSIPDRPNGPGC